MPVIENDQIGLKIRANVVGHHVEFSILEQSEKVSEILRELNDKKFKLEGNPHALTFNRRPAYNKGTGTIFLRGSEDGENNRVIEIPCENIAKARQTFRYLNDLVLSLGNEGLYDKPIVVVTPGSTSACRHAIISESQAKILELTGKAHFPEERKWDKIEQPVHVSENEDGSAHYNEHIGQFVDVLNKTLTDDQPEYKNGVVNPHKVDSESAVIAVDMVRKLFDEAEGEGDAVLIAVWRIVSGLRAMDSDQITDLSIAHTKKQNAEKAEVIENDDEQDEYDDEDDEDDEF